MFFSHHKKNPVSEVLARTFFITSTISFFVFLSLDLLRPGFVSDTFSVHWFLLITIVSGIWWGSVVKELKERRVFQILSAVIFGLVGVYTTWQFRADLSDFLVLFLPLVLVVPFVVLLLVRSD